MQRLGRADREQAIVNAIRKLNLKRKHTVWTRGEICRAMGIKSTSRIRDILRDMVASERLVCASTALDGYAHEVEVFGIPKYEQRPLPDDHTITINGLSMTMSYKV